MVDRLLLIVSALERRFPQRPDPFKMVTRLAEECGELAAEVQRWEDVGLKREKWGQPDRAQTAKELMDVLTATLTIARHYDLLDALADRVELAVAGAVESGHLTAEEAASTGG